MGKEAACIDTDICVDFLRSREPGFGMFLKALSDHVPYITSITAFELHLGHIKMKKKESLDDFINRFHILPFVYFLSILQQQRPLQRYRLNWMKKEQMLVCQIRL